MPPEILVQVASFLVGITVGSFLNVCIYRIPSEDMTVAKPKRSICPHCKATIAWYDNIPLLSYLWLLGRCRHCKAEISLRYFIVELLTGLLFLAVASLYGLGREDWVTGTAYAAFLAALVVVAFIDLQHQIIPDVVDKPGMVVAPLLALAAPEMHPFRPPEGFPETGWLLATLGAPDSWLAFARDGHPRLASVAASLVGIGFGWLLLWFIRVVGTWAFRAEAMGWGDVKLMGMIGGFLGWDGVLLTLLLACVAGSIVGAFMRIVWRQRHIPFGPYLALGAALVVLWEPVILRVVLEDYPRLVGRLVWGIGG